MRRILPIFALFLAAAVIPASATLVTENNAGDSPATAQIVSLNSFTLPAPATVFPFGPTVTIEGTGGEDDVDFYSVTFPFLAQVIIDVDDITTFDSYLALFDSNGTLIAYSDDDAGDPGSSSDLHSFTGVFDLPSAGTYYVAISGFSNPPIGQQSATYMGSLVRPDGGSGGNRLSSTPGDSSYTKSGPEGTAPYKIEFSYQELECSVPEPGTFALVGIGLVMGSIAVRRRRLS